MSRRIAAWRRAGRRLLLPLAVVVPLACASGARGAPPEDHDGAATPGARNQTAAADTAVFRPDPVLSARVRDTLRAILDRAIADSVFPGAFAVVGTSAGVVAEVGAGRLDWGPSPVPDEHTLWDLASLTKVVGTTTAAAQLVERAAIDLDAPVQRYLPEWRHPGAERVTVRHLLTHTSGLPAFRAFPMTADADSTRRMFYAVPLDSAPGTRLVYSDIGAFLLGEVVERVSGERLDRYLERHVFAPLGMRETMFNPPAALLDRIAPTEYQEFRGGKVRGIVHDERAWRLGGVAPHAGLFGSGHDLARFARMMLNEGTLDGARVLRPETVRLFTGYADSTYSNRGLGWQKPERPGMRFTGPSAAWAGRRMSSRAYGHTGFTGTSIAIDPAHDVFVVLLTNRVNPTRNRTGIATVRTTVADAIMSLVSGASSATSPASPQ